MAKEASTILLKPQYNILKMVETTLERKHSLVLHLIFYEKEPFLTPKHYDNKPLKISYFSIG